ncbi:unnamed protein product [Moneuplotes crassus]|uniref:Methyltransferase type 11 domain-containing protein n=1 Tax=Euplotes crassus TaxID=5936 RepID=A0AAD2D2N8_EUPCR|nr:unnamed protein product [Moneuplotes crassus]
MSISLSRAIPFSIIAYGGTSLFMYKYGKMKIANDKIMEIKNKREFLYKKHQEIAEGYEKMIEKREGINKLIRFRKTLISYATGKVLETGCGTGINSEFYKEDAEVTAVDWSKNMIQEALGKEYDTKKIKYKIADVENLPYKDESFDTVVDTFSLQSYFDRNKALGEIKRVLKPGGLFLVLGRGTSYVSLYNEYLQFRAGLDIESEGSVFNLDFEKLFEEDDDLEVEHIERKNLGMTYIMMVRKKSINKPVAETQEPQKKE